MKFHGVRKFSHLQFRDGKSRIIDHSTVRISSTSAIILQLLFGRVAQVSTNFAVLVSFQSPVSLNFLQHQVPIFKEEDAKFFESSKIVEVRPSRAGSRSKTFPEVPTIFRVSCGNPESRGILWRCCLCLNLCTTFWSRSLIPFDTDPKRFESTVSRSMSA